MRDGGALVYGGPSTTPAGSGALLAVTGAGGGAIPMLGPVMFAGGAMEIEGGFVPVGPTGDVVPVKGACAPITGG